MANCERDGPTITLQLPEQLHVHLVRYAKKHRASAVGVIVWSLVRAGVIPLSALQVSSYKPRLGNLPLLVEVPPLFAGVEEYEQRDIT